MADANKLRSLVDEIGTGAVLFLHLFHGVNSSAKFSELGEFLLDFKKSLLALAVCDLGIWV